MRAPRARQQGVGVAELDVRRWGAGSPVVLVHGSIVGAERTWRAQRPLGEHWALIAPNRPGYGDSPPLARSDFELEAPLIAELLGDGAHLVGQSYGGVIALLCAAQRPEAVRSLTVCEPGALRIARANPDVAAAIETGNELFRRRHELAPDALLRAFRANTGSTRATPTRLPDWLARGMALLMSERPSWEADIPLAELARTGFPKLVVSGGHSAVFDAVCDVLEQSLGAERAVIGGRGHTIPAAGAPFNARLHAFLAASEARRPR